MHCVYLITKYKHYVHCNYHALLQSISKESRTKEKYIFIYFREVNKKILSNVNLNGHLNPRMEKVGQLLDVLV